jgi:hypothetical protein
MAVDPHHPAITALVAAQVPCVGLDLPVRGPRATYVTSDNRRGAATAVRHLHGRGHRRIATITGHLHMLPAAERLAGYRYEVARLGLPYRKEYVVQGDFFLPSGYECMGRLLRLAEPPTALFAAGDEMAIGAMHAIADAGLRVPEDVAIVGFDDIEAASLVRPALTTIAQDRRAFGAAAVAALVDAMAAGGEVDDAPGAALAGGRGPGPGLAGGEGDHAPGAGLAGGRGPGPGLASGEADHAPGAALAGGRGPGLAGGRGPGLAGGQGPGLAGGRGPGLAPGPGPRILPTRLVVRASCGSQQPQQVLPRS